MQPSLSKQTRGYLPQIVLSLMPSSWVLWYRVTVGSACTFPGSMGSEAGRFEVRILSFSEFLLI